MMDTYLRNNKDEIGDSCDGEAQIGIKIQIKYPDDFNPSM